MTKLKGCLAICTAFLIVLGGAFYVFISSHKRTLMKPSDEDDRAEQAPSPTSSPDADLRRIVVPETLILTGQLVSDSQRDGTTRKPTIVEWNGKFGKPKEDKENTSRAPSKIRPVATASAETIYRGQTEIRKDNVTAHNDDRGPTMHPVNFDPYRRDSLVVIHIQKTGGSDFLRHLITATRDGRYLCNLPRDTQTDIQRDSIGPKGVKGTGRGIMCPRDPSNPRGEQWLICEKTLGWVCQLHTSYSEYKVCLPKLNNRMVNPKSHFLYSTILRHPVLRYFSEYLHFKRNATWAKRRVCGGKKVTEEEMPPCYPGFYAKEPWPDLTIEKFLSCRSNWANNRQTRMLADLESLGCYGNKLHPPKEKDRLMLESAKENLRNFAFFGLTEYQRESCVLFERTFGVKLKLETQQRPMSSLHSAPVLQDLWNNNKLYDRIATVNRLDMELYEYALQLFSKRVRAIGLVIDPDIISKEIKGMKREDIAKTAKKFKRFGIHKEFENKNFNSSTSEEKS